MLITMRGAYPRRAVIPQVTTPGAAALGPRKNPRWRIISPARDATHHAVTPRFSHATLITQLSRTSGEMLVRTRRRVSVGFFVRLDAPGMELGHDQHLLTR